MSAFYSDCDQNLTNKLKTETIYILKIINKQLLVQRMWLQLAAGSNGAGMA